MSQTLLSLAGFQVILIGRFWVIAEDARNGFPFLGGARNPVTIVTDLREK
jgi:hypothetical protein